ncbi:hypothetical protein F2P81_013032 [Scophthalmus maximus]|uniref:Uncharacterized protein n=1 Tax=Scophthalmus maximus TaxID=52904 RepID=A0A6A4SW43_SCOMX|nr:hypothetical protein F2P81_013032 [Scophthalmus maximus]
MERGVPTLSVVLKSNAGRSSATPRLLQLRVYHNVRPHGTELYDELYNRPSGSRSAPRGANADVTEVNAELHFRHHGLIPADPLPDHRKSGQLLLNRTLSSQWATGKKKRSTWVHEGCTQYRTDPGPDQTILDPLSGCILNFTLLFQVQICGIVHVCSLSQGHDLKRPRDDESKCLL